MPVFALPTFLDCGRESATQTVAQTTVATPPFDIAPSPPAMFVQDLLLAVGAGARIVSVTVVRAGASLTAFAGDRAWTDGTGAQLDNAGELAIAGQSVRFAGASLTALAAGTGPARFVIAVTHGGAQTTDSSSGGAQTILALLDTATGDSITGPSPALWRELERAVSSAGDVATLLRDAAGAPLVALVNAGLGFLPPDGRVTIAASDVGTGIGQIPDTYAMLQPAALLAHASVFVRRTGYVRGAGPALAPGFRQAYLAPITDPAASPISVFAAQRPATWSTWQLVVDGAPRVVTFAHDAARGLRRPRDLYADAIAPLVDNGDTLGTGPIGQLAELVPGSLDTDPPVVVVPGAGGYLRRLGFLSYARCLEFADGTPATYFSPVLEPTPPEPPPIPDPPPEN